VSRDDDVASGEAVPYIDEAGLSGNNRTGGRSFVDLQSC